MNNEERLDLINKQHCAEELIYKLEIATNSLKKQLKKLPITSEHQVKKLNTISTWACYQARLSQILPW